MIKTLKKLNDTGKIYKDGNYLATVTYNLVLTETSANRRDLSGWMLVNEGQQILKVGDNNAPYDLHLNDDRVLPILLYSGPDPDGWVYQIGHYDQQDLRRL